LNPFFLKGGGGAVGVELFGENIQPENIAGLIDNIEDGGINGELSDTQKLSEKIRIKKLRGQR
jgi:hypothetical protein